MKVLVDIKENKAAFILELLNSFGFVKTEVLTPEKEAIFVGVREAVEELNEIKKGKKKSQPLKKFLDELGLKPLRHLERRQRDSLKNIHR